MLRAFKKCTHDLEIIHTIYAEHKTVVHTYTGPKFLNKELDLGTVREILFSYLYYSFFTRIVTSTSLANFPALKNIESRFSTICRQRSNVFDTKRSTEKKKQS